MGNVKRSVRNGFTLIELVVVIAIIGILGFILMPKMLGFVERSAIRVHVSNVKRIEAQIERYLIENGNPSVKLDVVNSKKELISYFNNWPRVPLGYPSKPTEPRPGDEYEVILEVDGSYTIFPSP